jgi:Peptidase family M28
VSRARLVLRGFILLAFAYGLVARVIEARRIGRPLPGGGSPPPLRLDATQLLADVRELSSERFEGRRTGTPGGRLARELVAARFRELGLLPLSPGFIQPFSFSHHSLRALWQRDRPFRLEFPDAANVIGLVEGRTHPEQYFVVSAHYDHLGRRNGVVYPGADDNASGVAALLGMAAYFKKFPPQHSILFTAFDAEELGRRGSEAFLQAPPVPAERMIFNLNMDMVARVNSARLFAIGTGQHPFLLPFLEDVARRSAIPLHVGHDRSILVSGLVADWSTASDHAVFYRRGTPFLCFSVEDHEDYHQPGDTFDRIEPHAFTAACETILDTVLTLDRGWPPA